MTFVLWISIREGRWREEEEEKQTSIKIGKPGKRPLYSLVQIKIATRNVLYTFCLSLLHNIVMEGPDQN